MPFKVSPAEKKETPAEKKEKKDRGGERWCAALRLWIELIRNTSPRSLASSAAEQVWSQEVRQTNCALIINHWATGGLRVSDAALSSQPRML